jgi:nuclear transport factor 2 (NTF2) superfamily protein
VSLAHTPDSRWRNRSEFVTGRAEIVAFLRRKWVKELDYRLIKELWAFTEDRIAVRFAYEWHDDSGNWFRSYGNENWEFDAAGLMQRRFASINDLPIAAPTASTTGHSAGVRTTIRASPSWASDGHGEMTKDPRKIVRRTEAHHRPSRRKKTALEAAAKADRRLDAQLADSFPASDPPSILSRGPRDP